MTINFLRSIETGRVQTNPTDWADKGEIISFYVVNSFFLVVLLVFPTFMLIKDSLESGINGFGIAFATIPIILGLYLLFSLFKWKQLTKIDGVDIETNKELIVPIVNGYYPELTYEWDGDILIGSRPWHHFSFKTGLNIVMIFKENQIYLNILSINKGGPNPWMAYTNIGRAKEIGEILRDRIRHRPNDTQQYVYDHGGVKD